ncbi:MAG: hypothetical protein IT514_07365 [Burkholderiales bacterium]|nr:hypothetical protein [Burkholderiales bacterium]
MARISAAALSLLSFVFSLAFAAEEAEPPLEANMTAVWAFGIVVVVCIAWFVWYTMRNEKKPESEKEGEKF